MDAAGAVDRPVEIHINARTLHGLVRRLVLQHEAELVLAVDRHAADLAYLQDFYSVINFGSDEDRAVLAGASSNGRLDQC